MIPSGTYRAKASGGQWGRSKQKGTVMCRVSFVVTDGEHKGESALWDGYFADTTKARTVDALRNCGCTFPGDNVTDLTGLGDHEVSIVVEVEEWTNEAGESKTRSRVQWVNAIGGIPEDQQLDDGAKAAFAAQMKGLLVASRKKASPNGAAPKRPAQEAREPEEDAIPF